MGRGSALQQQFDWIKQQMGWTEISPIKTDTQLCLLAGSLADLLETSASHLIALLSALSHIPSGKDPHMFPKFRPKKLYHLKSQETY